MAATRDVHPVPCAAWRRCLAVVVGVTAMIALGGGPVLALALAAASPGPGAVVGGEVTVIELFYGDIIVDVDATVTGPDGRTLEAEAVVTSEISAELRLAEPLSQAGEYEVRHTIVAVDDEMVDDDYRFRYEPTAAPPVLVFLELEEDDGGLAWWAWTIVGAVALVVVVLAVRLVQSLRRAAHPQRSGSE